MTFSQQDEQFMRHALELAWQGRFSTSPNPRVGCVIVRGEQIVGQGFHVCAGEPHAEVHALRQAGELARGATAYVTLEPCSHYGRTPPCAKGLIEAGVARVVAAMQDPNPLVSGKGLAMLTEAGIAVQHGLYEAEARELNRGFLSRIERERPFVRVKVAISLDGKTALADGRSFWITGAAARHDVQVLRAESCAVLTGIGTILADNPRLNVRDFETIRQPIRVVLNSIFRLPESANVVQDGGQTWVFSLADAPDWVAKYANVRVFRLPENRDLTQVLQILARKNVGELLVEAGSTVASEFVKQDLADELVIYQAPKLLGETGKQAFRLPENVQVLAQDGDWRTVSLETMGDDVKWVLRRR
ncbi:bifunctional diaminohydroxyphosphoribosylaminopyrimidine deaminase/5-amino-6-(5-phosphoribosylamino)uracil reductase RibD [Kingella negevensis]|uniref:bifunctional diaminohydroxyphosphoribosylaminopyrimidine deaminase/5-amino-6-(5-phosphoribosylamino)uracil reductase RibD n=1 Tax=Kingella negevensis TaxID=1522312 RepID=UPI002550BE44|nr:bifunctional diaminohydroxyphosphoribosylaminopyrimidine deaminase/5-amino-6-(5-phosphoribosylamino)uracil reductase RibD [Kingella negevensis]MDK4684182.1 bifunctional diaminohydroxyphosphoribosylaminopyrimidine deaminase/5-amino-6-(5-phosphoribosylamino)uracil reductase RibD [Kingella negevensis]